MVTLCEWTDRGGYAENQDASFCLALPGVDVWAVFDGHGRRHGRLASATAAARVLDELRANAAGLLEQPGRTLEAAFAAAHAAVLAALRAAEPACLAVGGVLLRPADAADVRLGSPPWEALDGGTTASVCAFLRGSRELVIASCGDSSAMLVAPAEPPGAQQPRRQPTLRMATFDHSPVNAREYARVSGSAEGRLLRFVYDAGPEPPIPIWGEGAAAAAAAAGAGGAGPPAPLPSPSSESLARAAAAGVLCKNARGELHSLVLTPDGHELIGADGARYAVAEQALAMTRSLGDCLHHALGVTARPEIVRVRLGGGPLTTAPPRAVLLVLASDGLWDALDPAEVASLAAPIAPLVCAGNVPGARGAARALCERALAGGRALFGESCDNVTIVVAARRGAEQSRARAQPRPRGAGPWRRPLAAVRARALGRRRCPACRHRREARRARRRGTARSCARVRWRRRRAGATSGCTRRPDQSRRSSPACAMPGRSSRRWCSRSAAAASCRRTAAPADGSARAALWRRTAQRTLGAMAATAGRQHSSFAWRPPARP